MSLDQIRQLLAASGQGDGNSVQCLLDKGLPVDSDDNGEVTALQLAAANGHEHIVRLLLMNGAALDKSNSYGWTPLLQAARHGHVNVMALLLQNKADINARTKMSTSALTLAATGGHVQCVRLLLEAGVDFSNSGFGTNGEYNEQLLMTPLMAAALHGHDAVLRLLLDRGFNVNHLTAYTGQSLLMLAAANGHMTTAQILIERGADPNLTNVNGYTALDIASTLSKREVKGYLDRKTTNKPKLVNEAAKPDIIEAAKGGDISCMRLILNNDLLQRDATSPQDGATPLMFAAMMGRLDMAQLLVEQGCDINKQDNISGWTALMQATYHGKKDVAKYLISAGSDVSITAKNGCTAFVMASLIDDVDTELLQLLAAKTMPVNPADKKKAWQSKTNGAILTAENNGAEDDQKSGLKGWWNRLSNRFRNLKIGRTSNRLAPLPSIEDDAVSPSATLKPVATLPNESPLDETSIASTGLFSTTPIDPLSTDASITSYESVLQETKKSASRFTLDTQFTSDGTLKAVVPPFLPPPSFHQTESAERGRRTPFETNGGRRLFGDKPVFTPVKHPMVPPRKVRSSGDITPTSPSNSSRFSYSNPSPGSSGGASSITALLRPNRPVGSSGPSSTSSGTLTPADTLSKSGSSRYTEATFLPVKPPSFLLNRGSSSHRIASTTTSPSSSVSVGPTPSRSLSKSKSKSSKSSMSSTGSTSPTITPSASPTPGKLGILQLNGVTRVTPADIKIGSDEDELGSILKKISLEQYTDIFEEQEVDMEAFLTLTDSDLKELGISHTEPRRQILSTITELRSGKGRERQHFHDTMTSFQSKSLYRRDSSEVNLAAWAIQEEAPHANNSAKSRSS